MRTLFGLSVFIYQVSFTHLYRKIIIHYKWIEEPIRKNVPRIIISSVILSLVIETLFLITINIEDISALKEFPFNRAVLGYFNRSFLNFAWSVIYFAIHYFESYNNAKVEKLWYEMMLKDSELQLLKSQMHPHFIFNAINSINGLINENPRKAQNALSQLSSLLRYSLNANKNETVTLEEEMQVVSDYLEIESIRYEERLKVKMEIAPETLRVHIPPLMIQTICENGIKHGISKLPLGGSLHISSEIEANKLVIKVTNPGVLLEDEFQGEGYGIRNTRQRLSLLYGSAASFNISNYSSGLVLAEVKIPLKEIYEYTDN